MGCTVSTSTTPTRQLALVSGCLPRKLKVDAAFPQTSPTSSKTVDPVNLDRADSGISSTVEDPYGV